MGKKKTNPLRSRNPRELERNQLEQALANPMGTVALPASLEAGPRAYALIAEGECIAPEYDSGDVLICDPDARPAIGDFVAIWWRDPQRKPSVKRLVLGLPPQDMWSVSGQFEAVLVCDQLNPPKRLEARLAEVGAVHKVCGKAEAQVVAHG